MGDKCQLGGVAREGESCRFNNNCYFPLCTSDYQEPEWVCLDCTEKRGAKIPYGHVYTVHTDTCGICLQVKRVTEPRDFGRSRSKLRVKKKKKNERNLGSNSN